MPKFKCCSVKHLLRITWHADQMITHFSVCGLFFTFLLWIRLDLNAAQNMRNNASVTVAKSGCWGWLWRPACLGMNRFSIFSRASLFLWHFYYHNPKHRRPRSHKAWDDFEELRLVDLMTHDKLAVGTWEKSTGSHYPHTHTPRPWQHPYAQTRAFSLD